MYLSFELRLKIKLSGFWAPADPVRLKGIRLKTEGKKRGISFSLIPFSLISLPFS
jgi:hypothetical protein